MMSPANNTRCSAVHGDAALGMAGDCEDPALGRRSPARRRRSTPCHGHRGSCMGSPPRRVRRSGIFSILGISWRHLRPAANDRRIARTLATSRLHPLTRTTRRLTRCGRRGRGSGPACGRSPVRCVDLGARTRSTGVDEVAESPSAERRPPALTRNIGSRRDPVATPSFDLMARPARCRNRFAVGES